MSLLDHAFVSASFTHPQKLERRIQYSHDDAEEKDSGRVRFGSSDLELEEEQIVGLRFTELPIPQGAILISAVLQFQADERDSDDVSVFIHGEASDNASAFSSQRGNIFSRERTSAFVLWSPEPWTTVGEAGPAQQTPELSSVIQEIVNRPGWAPNSSLVLIVTSEGEDKRVAESYDGKEEAAPILYLEYVDNITSSN